jgi:hypothetical protein
MGEKINYKRKRTWSENRYVLYRVVIIGTIVAFISGAFLVLFVLYKDQFGLLSKAVAEYDNAKGSTGSSNNLISSIGNNASLIITFLGVVLLIITLISQTTNAHKNGFKASFFEFLKLHRSNVEQMKTKGKSGHDAFIAMYQELMEIIPLVENEKLPLRSPKQVYAVAYLAFFWGVGPSSSVILKDSLKNNYKMPEENLNQLIHNLEGYKNKRDKEIENQSGIGTKEKKNLQCLLDGHQSDLGHYFRHLYQTVTFISNERSLWYFEKYEYGKTLRAQFSNHELAIFLFNANSPLGKNWETEKSSYKRKLISYYALIKNVPPSLVNQLKIRESFPSIEFEFDEQ